MRHRLAVWLSEVASRLLAWANRRESDTVQLVEELADLAEPTTPAPAIPDGHELVHLAPTREIAIGLAMRDSKPGSPIIVHNGGPGCTGDAGCGCGAVAYRSDRGAA